MTVELIEDQDPARAGVEGADEPLAESESDDDLGIGDDTPEGEQEPEGEQPEGEEEAEGEEPDESAEAPPPDAKAGPPKTIPYDRFREVNEKRKAAEDAAAANAERAAELERQNQELLVRAARPENDAELQAALKAAKKALDDAIYDGEAADREAAEDAVEKARQDIADARAVAREDARRELERQNEHQRQVERATQAYQDTYKELIAQYPEIQTDADLQSMMMAVRDRHVANGMPWDKALRDAVESVAAKVGMQPTGPANKTATAKTRTQQSLDKHMDAARRIPPRNGPAGTGARQRGSVDDMTREEYDKLPDADRNALLGIG